jgi:hypothetical protein
MKNIAEIIALLVTFALSGTAPAAAFVAPPAATSAPTVQVSGGFGSLG